MFVFLLRILEYCIFAAFAFFDFDKLFCRHFYQHFQNKKIDFYRCCLYKCFFAMLFQVHRFFHFRDKSRFPHESFCIAYCASARYIVLYVSSNFLYCRCLSWKNAGRKKYFESRSLHFAFSAVNCRSNR